MCSCFVRQLADVFVLMGAKGDIAKMYSKSTNPFQRGRAVPELKPVLSSDASRDIPYTLHSGSKAEWCSFLQIFFMCTSVDGESRVGGPGQKVCEFNM